MTMRWSWIALGAGAYIAFVIASFPAATAYHWFAPDALRLSGIGGTVWSGRAALGSVPGLPMRELRWNLGARSLLLGRVAAEFEARLGDGFVNTRAVATPSRVRLEGFQASTRVATLSGLLPVGDARGQLSVSLAELVIEDGWPVNAAGTVRIAELAVPPLLGGRGSGLIDIGSFTIELRDTGGQGLVGTLDDAGGPLEIADGMLRLGLDRRYVVSGRVRARETASEELVQGVSMMTGEPDAQGFRPFEFPGSL